MATIAIGISPKADKGGNYTATIPVNALAEDGVPPEVGDTIQASVEGTVKSVDGGNATVSIDTINGEPVGEEASESSEEEAGEEGQEQGAGASAGGGPSGSASGASPATAADRLGLAPMGPAPPPTLRGRLNRAGTDLMRSKLMKGARGKPMPF